MHVVIVGCGRVGSSLALDLVERGHSVAVVDRRPHALARLAPAFTTSELGRAVVGIGFDRDVLRVAGIEQAGAVAAVTSGDNSNILIARVARENFGIERVVARIYDPKRAAVYQRLGIATVATVSWTTEQVMRRVLPSTDAVEWVDPTAKVSLVERQIDGSTAGQSYADIERSAGVKVVAVSRMGSASIVTSNLVAQEGDLMFVAVASDGIDQLDRFFAAPAAHAH